MTDLISTFESQGFDSPTGWLKQAVNEFVISGLPLSSHSNAYANVLRVKNGPGLFLGFSVYNSAVAAQFIQLFDSQDAPATGDVPVAVFTVATIANLAVSYIFPGRYMLRGMWLANSSTGPTYTAGSADCFFDAQFI